MAVTLQAGCSEQPSFRVRGRRALTALGGALAVSCTLSCTLWAAPVSAQTVYTSSQSPLYAGPSSNYPLVVMIGVGAPVAVQGCVADWSWCDVVIDQFRGWMPAGYLDYVSGDSRWTLLNDGYQFGFPIVGFNIGPYWDRYYRGSAWYGQRSYWVGRPAPVFAPPPGYGYGHGRPWGPPAYHPAPPPVVVRPIPVPVAPPLPVPVRPGYGPGYGPGHGPGFGPGYGPGHGPGYGHNPGYNPGQGPGWRPSPGGGGVSYPRPGAGGGAQVQAPRPMPTPTFQPPANRPLGPGSPAQGPGGSFRQGEPFGGRGGAPHQGMR